jgi:histidinol dehydrogenase
MRRVILEQGEVFSNKHLQRKSAFNAQALTAATGIVEDVRNRGDEAVREYTSKFDGVDLQDFRVSEDEIKAAVAQCPAELSQALEHAAGQIREFHERQLQQSWFETRPNGAIVGAMVRPIDAVGIYVPGGRALYPSTLLMNAIPASVAGVSRIAVVNPPTKDGSLDPAVLKAAELSGVTEIYRIGGAQAVAALAYGTEQIPAVDKITGPGNAFVAAAKKLVSGDVGIDMIAGPSEVCVVADETADPKLVAIDLMAQAEHDPLAACYLVTFSAEYADAVEAAVAEHMKESTRADITTASLDNEGLIVIAADREQALQAVNVIAPEHLELHIANPQAALGKIRHAGAIFMGEWTPEAVGDYVAGPNHTLPTGGTARFSSPLSVDEFIKKSSIIEYSPESLMYDADAVIAIAKREGLWAHAHSVELRKEALSESE